MNNKITRILLFANSAKHHERCLAGIDLDTGDWLRPVASKESGFVPTVKTVFDGSPLKPLDIVEFRMLGDVRLPWQRENRLIDCDSIRRVRQVNLDEAHPIMKQVADLSPSFLFESPNPVPHSFYADALFDYPSLALLNIPDFRLNLQAKEQNWQHRLTFMHGKSHWDLPLTDVRYKPKAPASGKAAPYLGGEAFICVSIGERYVMTDRHYKIAAGLITKRELVKTSTG
jgi:hypothetical protein